VNMFITQTSCVPYVCYTDMCTICLLHRYHVYHTFVTQISCVQYSVCVVPYVPGQNFQKYRSCWYSKAVLGVEIQWKYRRLLWVACVVECVTSS
jgi:hypothetical protein